MLPLFGNCWLTEASYQEETEITSSVNDTSNTTSSDPTKLSSVSQEALDQTAEPVVVEPLRQSTRTYTPIVDDAVVIVGETSARQRKRKREKSSGTSTIRSGPEPNAELVAFDYAAVPNILDGSKERVDEDKGKNKKSRQSKGEPSVFDPFLVSCYDPNLVSIIAWSFFVGFSLCIICHGFHVFLFMI